LDHHVQQVCNQLEGLKGQETAVRGVLGSLVERGLMLRAETWLAELSNAGRASSPAPFRTVFIRTRERPQTLRSLLATLAEHEQRWRSGHRYVLVDSSSDPAAHGQNAAALREFSAASGGCPSVHFDCARMRRHLQELASELPQSASALRYLLDPGTDGGYHGAYGVSLNWVTLLGAGERSVVLDDDHLFPLRLHPQWQTGLRLSAPAGASRIFGNVDQALQNGTELESDPLDLHAQLCGRSLANVLTTIPLLKINSNDLRGLAPSLLPGLGADSTIVATAQGHRGDTCAMSLNWLMLERGPVREQLLADRNAYLDTIKRPAVWVGANSFRLIQHTGYTTFMHDGSRLMPAVPPRGRGEDGVFSALLGNLHADAVQMEVPMAIGHRRPQAPDRKNFMREPQRPALAQVLIDQLQLTAPDLRSRDPQARLRVACAQIEDLAAMDEAATGHYLQGFLLDIRARTISALQIAMEEHPNAAPHWAADVRSLVEANGRALTGEVAARFAEWPEGISAEQGARSFREYMSGYAAGLRAWPDAFELARQRAPAWLDQA
jgi:hypothetical protein